MGDGEKLTFLRRVRFDFDFLEFFSFIPLSLIFELVVENCFFAPPPHLLHLVDGDTIADVFPQGKHHSRLGEL